MVALHRGLERWVEESARERTDIDLMRAEQLAVSLDE
jgi:hypothetical protein